MRPAIFFDRDGTLNEEVGYAGHPDQFHIYPFAAAAVRRVREAGYAAVVVTNQAGVARGFYDEQAVQGLHQILRDHLAGAGTAVDAIYYCPHHTDGSVAGYVVDCECRKPKPGMLRRAAAELDLDLGASWVIGDRYYDIALAHAVGARGALVLTGYGVATRSEAPAPEQVPDVIVADVLAAVDCILAGIPALVDSRP